MKKNDPTSYLTLLILLVAVGFLVSYIIDLYRPKSMSNIQQAQIRLEELKTPLGVWVWEDISEMTQDQYLAQLSQFQKTQISDIFLNVEWLLNIKERNVSEDEKYNQIHQFTNSLNGFIAAARTQGMRVHALAGGPEWITGSQKYIPPTIVDIVLNHNIANPSTRFAGLQFDIEFHNSSTFHSTQQQQISDFLAFVQLSQQKVSHYNNLHNESLSLGFAIPYWYDGQNGNIETVQFNNKNSYPFYHMADMLSKNNEYIVLMAYRNFIYGSNGVYDITQDERTYLEHANKTVGLYIGIETTKVDEINTSYYGKTTSELVKSMSSIIMELEPLANFKGLIIHEANSYLSIMETMLY